MKVLDITNNGFFDSETYIQGVRSLITFSWKNKFQKNQVFQRIKEDLNKNNKEIKIRDGESYKTICQIKINELEF